MKNICAQCVGINVNKVLTVDNKNKSEWLQKVDYIGNFINSKTPTLYRQKKTDSRMTVNVGKSMANRFVLYFCAKSSDNTKIRIAKSAYGNFSNHGISKVDNLGNVTFYFNCPQIYSEIEKRNRESFYRHVHFCISDINKVRWLKKMYTKVFVCNISLQETKKKLKEGKTVVINALPAESYAMEHIPNSYSLPVKMAKSLQTKDLYDWFSVVIQKNYKKIYKMLNTEKINLYEIPIVVYCAHSKCNASDRLVKELLKKGFVNIKEFKGGIKEWNR